MKEFIDKLISRLKAKHVPYLSMDNSIPYGTEMVRLFDAISIVNQLAEEYKHCDLCYLGSPCEYQNENAILPISELADDNGWIPYTTNGELPKEGQKVWLSFTNPIISYVKVARWSDGYFVWDNGLVAKDMPMAWKPYEVPAPYDPKGE